MAPLRSWLREVLDLLWPGLCPVCGEWLPGEEGEERGAAPWADAPALHRACLRRLRRSGQRPPDHPPPCGRIPLRWMLADEPAFFRILHAAKYDGRLGLLEPLSRDFAAWAAPAVAGWGPVAVVPVPDDPRRRRRRGGSAAGMLAGALARAAALPLGDSWLTRRRGIPPLARLRGEIARRAVLQGVVGVGRLAEAPRALPLILVDDQVTTGSTLAEAARLLAARGHPVTGLALAGAASAPRELDLDTRAEPSLESPGRGSLR